MRRGHRQYVPKVKGRSLSDGLSSTPSSRFKGCYECSQRRIDCDLTRPGCAKCLSKGIQCSGFGTRIRFSVDLKPRVTNTRRLGHAWYPTAAQVGDGQGLDGSKADLTMSLGRETVSHAYCDGTDHNQSLENAQEDVETSAAGALVATTRSNNRQLEILISPSGALPSELQYLLDHCR
jgi:hypothetical protein